MILWAFWMPDAGQGRAVAGRAGRLAVGRVGALGQQVEPVVARAGGRVHLGARDRARVAVRVADGRRVVHVADRALADQVDLLADEVVGSVGRVVGEPLGRRTEGVAHELLGAAARDAARRAVVDPVAELVRHDVHRADPLVGALAVADLHLGAVVVGVDVVEADADRHPAAGAVHAVAAQPGRHHLAHLLGGVERVDAAGLAVGRAAVAPDVVGAGERDVARGVLAPQRGGVAVGHRERRTGAARRDGDGAFPVAGCRCPRRRAPCWRGTCRECASTYTDWSEGWPWSRPLDLGLPGQVGGLALPHDQARGLGLA